MLVKLLMSTTILCLSGALALKAMAQEPEFACIPRADFVAMLEKDYGETLQAGGLSGVGGITNFKAVIEFYANTETGSWTLMGTDAKGESCLLSSGELYTAHAPALRGSLN
jgi:hypothetical protein